MKDKLAIMPRLVVFSRLSGRMNVSLAGSLICLAGSTVHCAPDEPNAGGTPLETDTGSAHPNVIFYLTDTVRRDHLGVYGYSRPTSPRLDSFSRDAVLFEYATAPSSWTRPSVASLLSGLHPLRHGALSGKNSLAEEVSLLGDYLKALGYDTAAFVTNPNVLPVWGFDRGFNAFYDIGSLSRSTRADEVNKIVFEHMSSHEERPFFYYIHTLDPHFPYDPPAPYGNLSSERRSALPTKLSSVSSETSADAIEGLKSLYDAEIAFSDACLGDLLEHLKKESVYDNTIFVFASDHGEEFQEHHLAGHGHSLFEEQLRVPLLIKFRDSQYGARRVAGRASLMDVTPTILSMLDAPIPPDLDGSSLLDAMLADAPIPDRPFLFDLNRFDLRSHAQRMMQSVVFEDLKYIRVFEPSFDEMLFDLSEDPTEQNNLVLTRRGQADAMRSLLGRMTSQFQSGFHLAMVNSPKPDSQHGVKAVLRSEGRFVKLRTTGFEEADRYELSEDGKTLTLDFQLINRANPIGRMDLIDEDRLSFSVTPPDALITVESLESKEIGRVALRLGHGQLACESLPYVFNRITKDVQFSREGGPLINPHAEPTLKQPSAYLVVVPELMRVESTADEAVMTRLKSLGYVGESQE